MKLLVKIFLILIRNASNTAADEDEDNDENGSS